MHASCLERYQALADHGEIEHDAAQEKVAARLDALARELAVYHLAQKSSALGWLFGRKSVAVPRGLYIWGEVGRGKTMLMDLFFQAAPLARKRRVHFHAFMQDVHGRIHDWRQRKKHGEVKGDDPVAPVAEALAGEATLLCFDEFHVTDIADAMILGRLFGRLFALGVVVVATSNVPPERLYENGLNRALFVPFLGLLAEQVEVARLDSRTDFRMEKLDGIPVWHVPADEGARFALDKAWRRIAGCDGGGPARIGLLGRSLAVPRAARGAAWFGFADLCEQPLGPADYLAIAENFHTLVVDGVPQMDETSRNEARRFITLVDTLYDSRVKLLASAAAAPEALWVGSAGYESFAFARTASRLTEMRSADYLALPHGRPDSEASGDATGLVET
ncbi:cell division protein ZapE [Blastochloris tepida]|uniref:Cell division protein ZapE n=1 Tax=Blastochloris tepida TaxID=2233851 RepID=A0A348G4E2_9HYPH|nr:cell division protein ZapE [Blastochloris tepida]BBF94425.1 cell division protein ZapE [Blastochloris tepida]